MKRTANTTKNWTKWIVPMIKSLCISVLITVSVAAVGAWLILRGSISESSAGYVSMGGTMLGALLGATYVAILAEERKWLYCLISGLVYWVTMILVNFIGLKGSFHGLGVTAVLIMGITLAVGFVLRTRKGSGKKYTSVHRKHKLYKMHK